MVVEEEGEVFQKQEIEDLELNFTVANNSGETIEIGSHLEIERFDDGLWESVERQRNLLKKACLYRYRIMGIQNMSFPSSSGF